MSSDIPENLIFICKGIELEIKAIYVSHRIWVVQVLADGMWETYY